MTHPIIQVTSVSKAFKEVRAVRELSFNIYPGEFVALLGPNGAGKTTMMEMIEGIQFPDSGVIRIDNSAWKENPARLRSLLGISLQETHFIEKLTVKETLELFASFYHESHIKISEVLHLVGLEEKSSAYTKNLSGGQKQKLALGIALLNKPQIILLDEPTTGLDPAARREVWEILHRLRQERGMTMILTTHYMDEAEFLCERIIIMDKGQILAEGTVDQLLARFNKSEKIEFGTDREIDPAIFPKDNLLKYDYLGIKWELIVNDIVNYLPGLLTEMKQREITLRSLECKKMTLDDLFITLTGRSLNE
ncbi:MAG: ABC transporter ATP-binding protein [Ignavibacteriaceae bacterium]|nr:ABC transporter ATP-binding protein [Ignavibacteriaceae bacterium]